VIGLIFTCYATLFLICFWPVLFRDHQFGYRDAGHFYYPLYERVQREWQERRWPLWEPEENAGMPLMGNPTAAVLYPGKVIYAILPYAWAARVYILAHAALAFVAMLILMRSWQTSWVGSGLSALAYGFGVPILFQYCNVIYLVGAAWLPLGFRAVDRWVRQGRRWGLMELAVVLAMQALGGDPQSSSLLGLAAGGYAAGIAWSRRRGTRMTQDEEVDIRPSRRRRWWLLGLAALGVAGWVTLTLLLARELPGRRDKGYPPQPLHWMSWAPPVMAAAWGIAGLGFLLYWRRKGWRLPLGQAWLGLFISAGVAVLVCSAQLLPVLEFTQQTVRAAAAGPHDIYPFSMEPYRLVELIWPNCLGLGFEGHRLWLGALKLPGSPWKIWVPSLYLGGLTFLLAASALGLRRGPPWRAWLSVIVVVSLLGSLGQYTSPIWATRLLAEVSGWPPLLDQVKTIGPLDPEDPTPVRLDGYLRDGDGGIYWMMATVMPGFRQFRFPAKLFTFTSLGIAALAGLGWDRLPKTGRRGMTAMAAAFVLLSLAVLAAVLLNRSTILSAFHSAKTFSSIFGPFDAGGAYALIVQSLLHGSTVLGIGLIVVQLARTHPGWAGAVALIATTADLAAANARTILTVPQAIFDSKPELIRVIEEAERADPSPGPFRIHRMPSWTPPGWAVGGSPDRIRELVQWEHDAIQPKYGITYHVEYTHTMGVAELYNYEWYFGGFPWAVRSPEVARALNVEVGQEVLYFPRRSFDMWNTRYFVVPVYPNGWHDEKRAYAAFLDQTEQIYPDPAVYLGPNNTERFQEWTEKYDYQVRRNLRGFPRAWVVHQARKLEPIEGLSRKKQSQGMQEITYAGDPIWHQRNSVAFDPLQLAWVEKDELPELEAHLSGAASRPTERVAVAYPNPQRAELDVTLETPGLVILADVYYPGWELTIDDKPAPIYRVNRVMRGAAVPSGPHKLVYSYVPRSFRVGCILSIVGFAALIVLGLVCAVKPVDPVVAGSYWPNSQEDRPQ
jgi:hypothetical protein